jgi:predicted Zn-dependent protease
MQRRTPRSLGLACRALALVLILTLVLPPSLAVTPARAGMFSFGVKEEKELGEKFNILVRSKLPMVEDSEVEGYVRDIVDRLSKHLTVTPFDLKVAVVKDDSLNAFAAPGGYVFVFTGMILNLDHESEVAGVLAHELSHISQRHIAKRIEQGSIMSIASLVGALAGIALGAATHQSEAGMAMAVGSQAAATQSMLNYSRDDEREADEVGMSRLVAAGYPPRGLPDAFKVLVHMKILQGAGVIPAYLATHPAIEDRINYLTERIARMPKDVVNRPDNDERFHRIQTIIRARYGDPETVIAYYNKKGPAMTKIDRLGLAIALGRTNDNDRARQAFEGALKEGGNDSLWLRSAGLFFLKVRDFDRARDLLRRAVETNPKDMVATSAYAQMLVQDHRFPEARELLHRVILCEPESTEAYLELGRACGESGDMFHAYLNMAYASVYANKARQSRMQMEKAKGYAKSEDDRREYAKLEQVFGDKSQYWPKNEMF